MWDYNVSVSLQESDEMFFWIISAGVNMRPK